MVLYGRSQERAERLPVRESVQNEDVLPKAADVGGGLRSKQILFVGRTPVRCGPFHLEKRVLNGSQFIKMKKKCF